MSDHGFALLFNNGLCYQLVVGQVNGSNKI